MNLAEIEDIFSKIKVPATHPSFYKRIFTAVSKSKKLKMQSVVLKGCAEEYDDLSKRAVRTQIQDDGAIRNVLRSRMLATLIVDEKGEILRELIPELIDCLTKHLYSLGPGRQFESQAQEQILSVVKLVHTNKDALILLKQVGKPYQNPIAEAIIRNTLLLPSNVIVTDAHARQAVLSALLCYLRQSVGSCFGTAPSIIIHDEQPLQFLKDMIEILGTGRLKRTFGGVEYAVPLSSSSGRGDLGKIVTVSAIDLGLSPGILAAFEAAGLIDMESSLREKVDRAREILIDTPLIGRSVDKVIRDVLMKHLRLDEKDLNEHQQSAAWNPSLLGTLPTAKGRIVEQFREKLGNAQNAFKAIAENPLLKSWEFTIASFAENKAGFTTWNLYASLGFNPQEQGGVGHKLYEAVVQKMEEANQKVQDFQYEYEQAYNQVKYLETRMRTTNTEQELQWLKAEYQSRRNEFYFLEEMRDKLNAKAHRFANLFNLLVSIYVHLFPQYFQEVYDADMQEVLTGPYDDTPAGFRLLYKHGRGNTAQWSRIYDEVEYINSLVGFFTATEVEIRHTAEMEGIEDEFSQIVTSIVSHVRSPEFLETSFQRMTKVHREMTAKPWAYISGGNMGTLVSSYYRREQPPTETARWVENPMELLVFIADTIKHLPHKMTQGYVKHPQKSMLMYSPTHAFLLKPGFSALRESWQNADFTYTAVRDELIKPMERFIDMIVLYPEDMRYLIEAFLSLIPENFWYQFKNTFSHFYGTMRVAEFREHVLKEINQTNGLQYRRKSILSGEEIDAKLFELLPLFSASQLRERVEAIFKELSLKSDLFEPVLEKIVAGISGNEKLSAHTLQSVCKAVILLVKDETSFQHDYHRLIASAAQKLGFAMPKPLFFADTNWARNLFGFVVNPGTEKLELWRVDPTGTIGSPMTVWEHWLDGSRKDGKWGIYIKPFEYEPSH